MSKQLDLKFVYPIVLIVGLIVTMAIASAYNPQAQPRSRWHVSERTRGEFRSMEDCSQAIAEGLDQLTPQQAREAKVIVTAVGSGGWPYCAIVWEEGR